MHWVKKDHTYALRKNIEYSTRIKTNCEQIGASINTAQILCIKCTFFVRSQLLSYLNRIVQKILFFWINSNKIHIIFFTFTNLFNSWYTISEPETYSKNAQKIFTLIVDDFFGLKSYVYIYTEPIHKFSVIVLKNVRELWELKISSVFF